MSLIPNNELVAVAWLKGVPGLEGRVATELPRDDASWTGLGFVQLAVVGGTPDNETGIRRPVFSIDAWAQTPGSGRPPWGKASQLIELVRLGVLAHQTVGKHVLAFPGDYARAKVMQARMLTEPQRIRDDASSFAHYTCDLALDWVAT